MKPPFFTRYELDEPAQCEADSIKALHLEGVCHRRTRYAIKSPRGTQDYACCKMHRQELKDKGVL